MTFPFYSFPNGKSPVCRAFFAYITFIFFLKARSILIGQYSIFLKIGALSSELLVWTLDELSRK